MTPAVRTPKRGLPALALAWGWVLLLSALPAHPAPLTTGADFLLMTTGARPDGMGQAFSAVADDINCLSFNPAGLGDIHVPEAGYGYEAFPSGIEYDFIGAGVPLGAVGVLGLGYIDMGTAPFNSTLNPDAAPASALDRAFVGAWAKSFTDFQLGLGAKWIDRQLSGLEGTGWAFDAGARVKLAPFLTVAASLMNAGPGIRMSSLEPLPTFVNLGLGCKLLDQDGHRLSLVGNGSLELNTQTQVASAGAEYWFQGLFALRSGYAFLSQDNAFSPDGFSAGAGVRLSFFELDYAFQPLNTLGMVHRLSAMVRWDGPWIAGGEPEAPQGVTASLRGNSLEIRWQASPGTVRAYRVLVDRLDGRPLFRSEPVVKPGYLLKGIEPGGLYRVAVAALGIGGERSFTSTETLAAGPPETGEPDLPSTPDQSVSRGIRGRMGPFGLELSWQLPEGVPAGSYNVYACAPSGQVEKVNREPKRHAHLLLTDVQGMEGCSWVVTALDPTTGLEKKIGSYLWRPAEVMTDPRLEGAAPRLRVSPQADRRFYLDWDRVPGAESYAILYSRQEDHVYELLEERRDHGLDALLGIRGNREKYYFVIVQRGAGGKWMGCTNEVQSELLPALESNDF